LSTEILILENTGAYISTNSWWFEQSIV